MEKHQLKKVRKRDVNKQKRGDILEKKEWIEKEKKEKNKDIKGRNRVLR
jgi:hypothetical protein